MSTVSGKRPITAAVFEQLTGPGGPFEMHAVQFSGVPCRWYANRPMVLSALYQEREDYAQRVLAVDGLRRVTYRDAFLQAAALADHLRHRSLGRAARVAIVMRNRIEWLISFIAITAIGGVAVAVNSRGAGEEIRRAIADAECVFVLADRPCAERLSPAELPITLPLIVAFDEGEQPTPNALAFNSVIAGWQEHPGLVCAHIDPEDLALLMFTAGTTGTSKAAMLTHRSVMAGVASSAFSSAASIAVLAQRAGPQIAEMAAKMQTALLLASPLFHVSGCHTIFLRSLSNGGKLILMRKWNPESALELIAAEQVQQVGLVPTMLWDMLRAPNFRLDKIRSVMVIGGGGAPFPANLRREASRLLPHAVFGVGYGLTETNGPIATAAGEDFMAKPDASGLVQPAYDVRLLREDGTDACVGEEGEILIRGASVMSGYLNRPKETAEALRDGWLHTGDIGRFDTDGALSIVDRKKHMVISGGENIYCAEVERAFSELPHIREVLAFGLPDERLGEKLAVVLVGQPGVTLDEQELRERIAPHLGHYKQPKAYFFRDEILPRTPTGKVDRRGIVKDLSTRAG